MKIEKPEIVEIRYPSKKLMASLAVGIALSTTACTGTPKPKASDATPNQIEQPEAVGGDIVPVEPVPFSNTESTSPATSCDANISKPNQIKHPQALAGKVVAPRR